MPEGHTIHRIARDHGRLLAGRRLRVSSPQGRFTDAHRVDGATLVELEAYGKHLFCFNNQRTGARRMTTTTNIPTGINLAPLIAMRSEAEALVERLVSGQRPSAHEVESFQARAKVARTQIVDIFLLHLGERAREELGRVGEDRIVDGLSTVLDLLSGLYDLDGPDDSPAKVAHRWAYLYAQAIPAGRVDESTLLEMQSDDGLTVEGGYRVHHLIGDDTVIVWHDELGVEERVAVERGGAA